MSRGIRFHAAARAEFLEAAAWYEARQVGLGVAFIGEIEHCVERAADQPMYDFAQAKPVFSGRQ